MSELPELTDEQWLEHLERLTLYAVGKFRRLNWVGAGGDRTGPRAKSPQDVACEAVMSVLAGKRKYNKQAYSDFGHFLRSAVDSMVSRLVKSFDKKKFRPMPVAADQEDCEEIEFEGREPSPEESCLKKEMAENVKAIVAEEFQKDTVVMGMLECFEAGITKPAEIAELISVNVKEIYNARKRLLRVIEKRLPDMECQR